ncbi:MAG: hypothetical protein LBV57_02420 [Candidatus Symbiothrix sp.]|jgi:tetratricopeptide (TPR) repeat protein|nr:hypothetical protein [Candidatus Symbiothrix sp.]
MHLFNDFDMDFEEDGQESFPDFYLEWDESLSNNRSPHFVESDELCEIIEIYLNESELDKARQSIRYALHFYPNDLEMIYDISILLNDFELWEDILTLVEEYKEQADVWMDGNKICALLHLGMEEDAFLLFQGMKSKYENDSESLSVIYQAMCEALIEVDLFEASLGVINEAVELMGEQVDFYWLKLQAFVSLEEKEKAVEIAEKIEQINPWDTETWLRIGAIYADDLDEAEKAIDAFEFAESLGSKQSYITLRLITLYEKQGIYFKALEKIKVYLKENEDAGPIHILAINMCSQLNLWEEALHYVDEALKFAPEISLLYLYKSNFLAMLGEIQKAKSILKEGIRKTDDSEGELIKEFTKLQEQYPDN